MLEGMAEGRVCTGFSYPVVGKYKCSGGNVTFTEGRELARGVDISLALNEDEDNTFHANNEPAESETGKFSGGKINLTVDGPHPEAKTLIFGLPAPEQMTFGEKQSVQVTRYGGDAKPPYVGIGVVVRYESGGVEFYVPTVYLKTKFHPMNLQAKTQEKRKEWQTQKMVADLLRSESTKKDWQWELDDVATEAEARALLDAVFGIAHPGA